MKKINKKGIKENFLFYDFENQKKTGGFQTIIEFINKDSIVTYSDLQFGRKTEDFIFQKNLLINFIVDFIKIIGDNSLILFKYEYRWLNDLNKFPVIHNLLLENNMNNDYSGGIEISVDDECLICFLESILMYNSFINIILPFSKVIITPTDHMDIFINYDENKISDVIYKLINNISDFQKYINAK